MIIKLDMQEIKVALTKALIEKLDGVTVDLDSAWFEVHGDQMEIEDIESINFYIECE